MKDNKIMGNAGKATLPKGEKLSDKIEQGKVNQKVNNSKQANKENKKQESATLEDKKSQSSNGDQPKGKTSTGLPDVQGMGTEAAKQTLKTAAGTVPYTSWIPKGIRDKIIDKFMDSRLGQKMVDKTFKQIRMKIILAGIGIVCGLLMTLFTVAAVATLVMSPVSLIQEAWDAIKDGVMSVVNLFAGYGFCSSEEECSEDNKYLYYEKLDVYAENYFDDCGISMNGELITATIFYDRMVTKDNEDAGQFESENIGSNTYYTYTINDLAIQDDLVDVYRNRTSAATCQLAAIPETLLDSMQNAIDALGGNYSAADIDNFLLTYQNSITNGGITAADFERRFGRLMDGKVNLWEEFVVEIRKLASCANYVFDTIKYIFGFGPDPCVFNEDNYKNYLIDYYIPDNYAYLTGPKYNMTKEEIANEIFVLGEQLPSYEWTGGSSNQIIVGAGIAGAIPEEILKNSSSPMGNQYTVQTSCFGYYSINNCTQHTGVDLVGSVANPILYSIADGEVVSVVSSALHCEPDWINGKACSVCANSTGNKVIIKHSVVEDGVTYVFYSEYLHLKSVNVKLGQEVSKGEQIAIMGNTGCSTGTHLHFNMLDESKRRYNPEELMQYLNMPLKDKCEEARQVCSQK